MTREERIKMMRAASQSMDFPTPKNRLGLSIWALLTSVAVTLFIIVALMGKCSAAQITWGKQAPYDSWKTSNAEFFLLEYQSNVYPIGIGLSDINQSLVIQAQTAHTNSLDSKLLAFHWRLEKEVSMFRLFAGLGVRLGESEPSYGPSGVLGHFGIDTGWKHLRIGLVHYSDPLYRHDRGRNFLTVGWRW